MIWVCICLPSSMYAIHVHALPTEAKTNGVGSNSPTSVWWPTNCKLRPKKMGLASILLLLFGERDGRIDVMSKWYPSVTAFTVFRFKTVGRKNREFIQCIANKSHLKLTRNTKNGNGKNQNLFTITDSFTSTKFYPNRWFIGPAFSKIHRQRYIYIFFHIDQSPDKLIWYIKHRHLLKEKDETAGLLPGKSTKVKITGQAIFFQIQIQVKKTQTIWTNLPGPAIWCSNNCNSPKPKMKADQWWDACHKGQED